MAPFEFNANQQEQAHKLCNHTHILFSLDSNTPLSKYIYLWHNNEAQVKCSQGGGSIWLWYMLNDKKWILNNLYEEKIVKILFIAVLSTLNGFKISGNMWTFHTYILNSKQQRILGKKNQSGKLNEVILLASLTIRHQMPSSEQLSTQQWISVFDCIFFQHLSGIYSLRFVSFQEWDWGRRCLDLCVCCMFSCFHIHIYTSYTYIYIFMTRNFTNQLFSSTKRTCT